ncbi:MAG: hypothetical protein ACREPX_07480 [Rhodanobacteraceae bacterium]
MVPWNDAQVAFDITTESALWRCSSEVRRSLPQGWALDSTISVEGVQRVIFRVGDTITQDDGDAVKAMLMRLGVAPDSA